MSIDRRLEGGPSALLKADLHVHSSFSSDVPKLAEFHPRALYDRAVARGLGLFTLTDHDTMAGLGHLRRSLRGDYGDRWPIPVVNGVELKIRDPEVGHTLHVNVLGLDSGHLEALQRRTRSVDRFIGYCRAKRLFHVYNHPFWFERGERPNFAAIERIVEQFPVIELNSGRIRELNQRTSRMAARFGKPLIAASDTHTGQVGKSFTLAEGRSADGFLLAILAGRGEPFPSHLDFRSFMTEICQTVDLFLHGAGNRRGARVLPARPSRGTRIVQRMIESRLMWRTGAQRRGLGLLLKLGVHAPAYHFIREQRRMLLRMGQSCC